MGSGTNQNVFVFLYLFPGDCIKSSSSVAWPWAAAFPRLPPCGPAAPLPRREAIFLPWPKAAALPLLPSRGPAAPIPRREAIPRTSPWGMDSPLPPAPPRRVAAILTMPRGTSALFCTRKADVAAVPPVTVGLERISLLVILSSSTLPDISWLLNNNNHLLLFAWPGTYI